MNIHEEWQAERHAGGLREEIMGRIVVREHGGRVVVRLRKREGFDGCVFM